jgi:protein involved in polysaccharide export with SLBB domain
MNLRYTRFLRERIIVALVLACAAPASAAIHPGDLLSIHVYNHPDLSSDTVKVDSHGQIQTSVTGPVTVAGLEPGDVAKLLRKRLVPYIPFPAVDVRDLTESTTLFVAGGPGGVIPFSPGETLGTALADVEKELQKDTTGQPIPTTNITDQLDRSRIDTRRVGVIRDGKLLGRYDMVALRKQGDPGPVLLPNDTVSFADKPVVVDVLGDVTVPGKAYLWQDEPLSDAVTQAGGLKDSAATGGIEFTRADEKPRLVAQGDPVFFKPAEPGDVVLFPTAPRVTVAGMVYTPGVTTLKNNFTLLSAMYSAGGITKWANLKDVQVTHQGTVAHYDITKLEHGDQTQNPALADGDTVFVPEGHKIDFSQFFYALFGAGNIATNAIVR